MEGLDQCSVEEGKSNGQNIVLGAGPDLNADLLF